MYFLLPKGTIRSYLLIFISLLNLNGFSQQVFSKQNYPLTDFGMPLRIAPPTLAGSFGELRANHFHSGIDFKTNQRTGYPVYATADGYISRLRVQNSGFGLALYINHPNGYTSVYGHLSRFAPKIAEIAKNIQYKNKSYEIDEFPDAGIISVRKGDVIAYSGNSGSSGGPHLHFELRDTKTEITINPQLLGIPVPDHINPVIHSMYVYRLNEKPFNEYTPKQYFQVLGRNGKYNLNKVKTIHLNGEVGFGISTTDKSDGLSGTNGVYSIELEMDGQVIFTSAVERFRFENSRAVNSHIDYPAFVTFKRTVQKSFVDPGNPLQFYNNVVNNGRITFNDNKLHQLKYIVTDSKGNKSELSFNVQSDTKAAINSPVLPEGLTFSHQQANEYRNDEVEVVLPKGTLYNDLNFIYKKLPKPGRQAFSAIHQIQNTLTPLHLGFGLSIKADSTILPFQEKALIVNTNRTSQGGYFENGYVKATPKAFGSFYIAIDTIPPTIIPLQLGQGKNLSGISKINFKIRDNLSGIKSFNGYIDGKWILMEFDTKTAHLWHTFDERTPAGKHQFELIVADLKNNISRYVVDFYR